MNNQKQGRKTNLYKANVLLDSELDDYEQGKVLSGVYEALKEYKEFIETSRKVVQKQGTVALTLRPEEVEVEVKSQKGSQEKKIKKELRFYIELEKLSRKKTQRVENELFQREISYVYSAIPSGDYKNDEKFKIEILKRVEQESYLILDTDEEIKTIYFKANDYQLKMQEKAILELMRRPKPEQEALLRLFDRSYRRSRNYFSNSFENITVENWSILSDLNFNGTGEQRQFVEKALGTKDFALLEGPPGSGKTTAIIELIIQLIERGKRVLLVSATHVAVDNVIHRILTSYKRHCEGKVVPIRIANNGSIRKKSVEPYRLQDFVKNTKKGIRQSLRNRQDNKARKTLYNSLNKNKEDYVIDDIILNSANLVGGTMIGILQHPSIKKGTLGELFDVMIVDESSKVTFLDFIVPARYAKKWILVGDVKQLSPYVEDDFISESIEQLMKGEENEKSKILEGFELYKKIENPSFWEEDSLKILFSDRHNVSDFEQWGEVYKLTENFEPTPINIFKINSVDILICENSQKCKYILKDHIFVKSMFFEDTVRDVSFKNKQNYLHRFRGKDRKKYFKINNYKFSQREAQSWGELVGSKLAQMYQYRMAKENSYGEKIKKELAYLVPQVLQESVEKTRRVALPSILELLQVGVGDSKTKNGYSQESILYKGFSQFRQIKKLKFQSLTYQHRMNDTIAEIPRRFFYDDENLKTANTVDERPNYLENYKLKEADVIWSFNNDQTFRKKDKNINPTEVKEIKSELTDFLHFAKIHPKIDKEGGILNYEVAVLTFYRQQEYELRQMLRKFCNQHRKTKFFSIENIELTLCTVDKFQGDEADLILLSFVKNTKGAFYNSPNRLNVALTRARYKLILFGNKKLPKNAPLEALRQLANEFDNRKKY